MAVTILTAIAVIAYQQLREPDAGPLGRAFVIVSGSENKSLEPIVQTYCADEGVECTMRYQGSLNIGIAVEAGTDEIDAVWPANGIWIDIFDRWQRVRHLTSISRSPVVLGVRRSKAESLGWIDQPVSMDDIVDAVVRGDLRFLMTSATQSNSGAGAYFTMLSAAVASDDQLTLEKLNAEQTQDKVRRLLRGVERSSGSSGWLRDLFLRADAQGIHYDAMWNYEAILAEANQELRRRGSEQLWAIYPTDGVVFADSPLGYVDRDQPPEFEQFFLGLQAHLLSPSVQNQLVVADRRVAEGRASATATPDPSWNYDPERFVRGIRMPSPEVVRTALTLYQETLRRPSLTAYCLDFSSSMAGAGEADLKEAMALLLQPERAREVLIQSGQRDRFLIIPFNTSPRAVYRGSGHADDQARLLERVNQEVPSGDSNIFSCITRALDEMRNVPDLESFLPAIVLMTDGQSDQGTLEDLEAARHGMVARMPVFGITFGKADAAELERIAEKTSARVFDGTNSLVRAFRTARGYN